MATLVGFLKSKSILVGTLTGKSNIVGLLKGKDILVGTLSAGMLGDPYSGEYTIIPKAYDDQTLETQGLNMQKDLTVTKVPYFEVSNPKGGLTIYIAEDTNE